MGKAAFIVCLMLIGLLVYHAECTSTSTPSNQTTQNLSSTPTSASQTTPSSSSPSSMTTGAGKQTTQKLPSTTTENIRDFISRLIKSGISDGMKALLDAVVSNSESTTESTTAGSSTTSQTTALTDVTSAATTSGSSSTSTAGMAATCPEGLYDQNSETVTFAMEDKNCQITIYLSKPPKEQKQKKEKKVKKDKKGKNQQEKDRNQDRDQGSQRFLEKNIAIGPIRGMETDQCPEVTSRQFGKDGFLVQTSECAMYVKKMKKGGKGKNGSQTPLILSQALGQ